jgi:hypothetical protein
VTLAVPARAQKTMVSGDLDYAHSAGSGIGGGWGFGVRLGRRLHVPLLALDPEVGFTYHGFHDRPAPALYRGILGLRLGIGEVLRPGIYGHIGVGRIDFDTTPEASRTAFTHDLGLFLDFTLLPLLDLGVHVAYEGIASSDHADAFNWVTAGAHAALVF